MSEKKINIDLGLFQSFNKTRKKKPSEKKDGGIKIKPASKKPKNDSLKKKSILKMIRQHQEDRYSKLFQDNKTTPAEKDNAVDNFKKDFEDAQQYMTNLIEKKDLSIPNNRTVKNYSPTNSLLYHPSVNTFSNVTPVKPLNDVTNSIISGTISPTSMLLKPMYNTPTQQPQFGCLKNGQLPTYRDYMNKTRKNFPNTNPIISGGSTNNDSSPERKIDDSLKRIQEIKNSEFKLQQLKSNIRPKKMKRKKTLRRTYKIGKSKIHPKVSVLISNKTIRNNISTKSQLIKQTPIEEVKKHLIKVGLIKIGTIAPNDVLRKMYESSILMCGEVQNHNPDYLLYNFMNSK